MALTFWCDTCSESSNASTVEAVEVVAARSAASAPGVEIPGGWNRIYSSVDKKYRLACPRCVKKWQRSVEGYETMTDRSI